MTLRLPHMLRAGLKTVAAAATAALVSLGAAQAQTNYILATASTGGTYYPVGVAVATLVKVRLQPSFGIGMAAINSAGSGENVKLLRENEAQFAILQGLYGYYAWNGVGPLEEDGKQDQLRSISMLWQNVEQFAIASDRVDTGTISDLAALKGEALALGRRNSGTLGSNTTLMANLGMNVDDYELVYVGYGPSGEALQNGQVVGMSTPAGVPTGAVSRTFASMGDGVTLLNFTDEQMAQADGGLDLWTRYVIPAGTYSGQDADVNTIAQPNLLAVRADVDEEHVYLITKTMYENLPFLQNIHPATKAMALEKALAGLPLPLHPGAARYYREAGLEIPARLIAE